MTNPKYNLVRLIRRTQTLISIILFLIVMVFCWKNAGLALEEIQLSYWGGDDYEYNWAWNSIVILLSISIFINNMLFIQRHIRLKYKKIPYIMFSLVAFCLFLVGCFNIEYEALHDIPAWIYFFAYPFSIFTMAYLNRKILLYREWFTHLIFSIVMMLLPITFVTVFEGLAISEILHSLTVCVWNIYTAFKRFDLNIKTTK